jgi:hypothetical protein
MVRACSAAIRSSSTTTPPRATLISTALRFIVGERRLVDQPASSRRQRAMQAHDVGLRQQLGRARSAR